MRRFSANPQDAVTSVTLFNRVVGQGSRCGTGRGGLQGPHIYCIHFPTKFVASLNGNPTFWDNSSFAFLGDMVQGQVMTVIFPSDTFDTITTGTKTSLYMLQHLDALIPATPLFPPVVEGEVDSIKVTVCKVIYLPAVYVPLFLSAGGYTIK